MIVIYKALFIVEEQNASNANVAEERVAVKFPGPKALKVINLAALAPGSINHKLRESCLNQKLRESCLIPD